MVANAASTSFTRLKQLNIAQYVDSLAYNEVSTQGENANVAVTDQNKGRQGRQAAKRVNIDTTASQPILWPLQPLFRLLLPQRVMVPVRYACGVF